MSENTKKVAVVTGGRRGIGRAIAYSLADAGWRVQVLDVVEDAVMDDTMKGLSDRGADCAFMKCDVADVANAETVSRQAMSTWGRIDALINNAGVQVQDRTADALSATVDSFDRLINVNLRGTFFLTQAVARAMIDQPGGSNGYRSIVTVSSSNALHAKTRGAEYCISKSGLSMMNKVFALQLAAHGIACFEVQPGLIKTEMNESMHAVYDPIVAEGLTPMPRWGVAEDVGRTVATLVGGGLPFSTGETLYVDGGLQIPKSPFESPFVRARMSR